MLCRDSFNLLSGGEDKISLAEINKFCSLVGKQMTHDEYYFFIKKCLSSDGQDGASALTRTHQQLEHSIMEDDEDVDDVNNEERPILNLAGKTQKRSFISTSYSQKGN